MPARPHARTHARMHARMQTLSRTTARDISSGDGHVGALREGGQEEGHQPALPEAAETRKKLETEFEAERHLSASLFEYISLD